MDLEIIEIKKNKRRAYYENNREAQKARTRKNQAKAKKIYEVALSHFRSNGCERCSEKDPSCLQAHHINPETKKFAISGSWASGRSIKALMNELGKCVCLCANCHSKLHAGRFEL